MQLNEAVSARLKELLRERNMTQYQLYIKSGVPKSSIGNIVNCAYDSVKLRVIHEICQGLESIFPISLIPPSSTKAISNRKTEQSNSDHAVLRKNTRGAA